MKTPADPGSRGAARALLAAASLASLAAAASPRIPAPRAPTLRVLLHDASASRGARAAADDDELAALVEGLGGDDRVAVVAFGADARAAAPPCPPKELVTAKSEVAVDPDGTSLVAALAAAARLAAADEGRRRLELVIATDARVTDDAAPLAAAASSLASSRCASWRVLRRGTAPTDSVVAELRGPGAARAGEPFALEARGVAVKNGEVVELSDASGVVETRRVGPAGPFRLAFARIEESGAAAFAARIVGGRDVPRAVARVAVGAPGRALVVCGESSAAPLSRALPADAVWAGVGDVKTETLAAYDAAVFDDVAAARLSSEGADAVRAFVRRGGGLLLLGGPEWAAERLMGAPPFEGVSPLLPRPPERRGTFLYVAVDGSGSMAEPWGTATRDAVVRSALETLIRGGDDDVTLALRRFSHALLPEGSPPATFRLDAAGRDAALGAVKALPPPGGPTALLPPLKEALAVAASRPEPRRHVVVLTDGRTPEDAEELRGAIAALRDAGALVSFVLPGDGALADDAQPLKAAVARFPSGVAVHGTTAPEKLLEALRRAASDRSDAAFWKDRRLAPDPGAADVIGAVPDFAAQSNVAWASDDARRLVLTEQGAPVAALRREGLGAVAALATRPGDPAWLAPGDKTSRLVASLIRAVARKASGRVRVERDGPTRVLVRCDGRDAPAAADARRGAKSPLVPADAGLLAADVPRDAEWIDLLAADGRVVATAGLDTPAPAEYLDPPEADLDALAALACGAAAPPSRPLAAWLAAAAVVLALSAVALPRIKSKAVDAR